MSNYTDKGYKWFIDFEGEIDLVGNGENTLYLTLDDIEQMYKELIESKKEGNEQ